MVKHTQMIRRQIADELFECVWPFVWGWHLRVKSLLKMQATYDLAILLNLFQWKIIFKYQIFTNN